MCEGVFDIHLRVNPWVFHLLKTDKTVGVNICMYVPEKMYIV